MKKIFRLSTLLISLLLINLVASLFIVTPVKALDTTLSIVSSVSDICVGDELTVMVRVSDVVDLYGFDVLMNYNPAVIEVISVEDTSWLPLPITNLINIIDNTTGYLRHTTFRTGGGTGVSGTGDILQIHLKVKAPGAVIQFSFITTGTYRTKLSDSNSSPITYVIGNTGNTATHSCLVHFPNTSRITCTATTITVRVEDIFNFWGYDLKISYDPNIIRIDNVTFDNSFIKITNYPYIDFSQPGSIRVYGTATSPALPSTGSGVLINILASPLVFNSQSGLTIQSTSEFTDRQAALIPITIENYPIYTYGCDPNAVDTLVPTADRYRRKITLNWQTVNEQHIAGFNVYRSGSLTGLKKPVNVEMIQAEKTGQTEGDTYSQLDRVKLLNKTYYYWVETIYTDKDPVMSDPIKVKKWQ